MLADFEIDPYHAVAETGRTTGVDRAATAALIVDGLARIDTEGDITLTERGAEPSNTPHFSGPGGPGTQWRPGTIAGRGPAADG
ncbi:hypothetical protein [Streptomyces sp. NRRL S-118]|uniref:hypothetical protein n=1 Tax=Streptomyces sp. NRRL S-118 TaxID=1463881 RepID=UPI0004C5757C|nr:hypothetical protein [Streptomyces sp. NRRL S-118]